MFGKRLKELREGRELSMDKLVELYNNKYDAKMNKSTLSRYENGLQDPIYTVVVNLADFFNVSVDYISGREADADIDLSKYGLMPLKTKKFRMLGEIACGEPIFADEDFETFIEANADINADFCLTAKGDSMINARIFDGDIVFIKEQPTVENGEIAAVIINDEATLKRVYRYPESGKLVLNPENPKYEPFVYTGDEVNQIRILGKAVAFQSYVR
ncbi:MAG: helix-turn-helix domain-containing protein [Clostridia bacterium]|nr:helix-turn-helix domain-containing protein [Clostridia bacterium]